MTIQERLDAANQRSVALYLQRQKIEEARQQIAQQANAADRELLTLDGQIDLLTALIAEPKAPDGQ
jgi:hypothetical protein